MGIIYYTHYIFAIFNVKFVRYNVVFLLFKNLKNNLMIIIMSYRIYALTLFFTKFEDNFLIK